MNKKNKKIIKNNQGMATLITVVLIGAATLLMAKGALYLSMGELDMRQASAKNNETISLAENCLEDALLRLKHDNNFTVLNYEIFFENGKCSYDVVDSVAGKIIYADAVSGKFQKNIKAEVSVLDGEVKLDSWEIVFE